MSEQRTADTQRFYALLADLERRFGGKRRLRDCSAAGWPSHGVYFFFEDGQTRGDGLPRVVRVGTHALTRTSRTTLWNRLSTHRGQVGGAFPGGGNHRGSIFRLHVGTALLATGNWPREVRRSWRDPHPDPAARQGEHPLERAVSNYIGAMPLLWVPVADRSHRSRLEQATIALLSCRTGGIDPPTADWLGLNADSDKIRTSGLWNVNHVDEHYDASALEILADLTRPEDL